MNKKQILSLLLRDTENKKSYGARFNLKCNSCNGDISKGDEFYFYGKQKTCRDCFYKIIDFLESNS